MGSFMAKISSELNWKMTALIFCDGLAGQTADKHIVNAPRNKKGIRLGTSDIVWYGKI